MHKAPRALCTTLSGCVNGLAGARDAVFHVHADRVAARSAVHVVPFAVLGLEEVIRLTAEQCVAALAAVEFVVATAAGEPVFAGEPRILPSPSNPASRSPTPEPRRASSPASASPAARESNSSPTTTTSSPESRKPFPAGGDSVRYWRRPPPGGPASSGSCHAFCSRQADGRPVLADDPYTRILVNGVGSMVRARKHLA
jgi:hypothetical protein